MSRPIVIGAGHNGLVVRGVSGQGGTSSAGARSARRGRRLRGHARARAGCSRARADAHRRPSRRCRCATSASTRRACTSRRPRCRCACPPATAARWSVPRDVAAATRALAPWSPRDAERWPAFVASAQALTHAMGAVLRPGAAVDRRAVAGRAVGAAAGWAQAAWPGPPGPVRPAALGADAHRRPGRGVVRDAGAPRRDLRARRVRHAGGTAVGGHHRVVAVADRAGGTSDRGGDRRRPAARRPVGGAGRRRHRRRRGDPSHGSCRAASTIDDSGVRAVVLATGERDRRHRRHLGRRSQAHVPAAGRSGAPPAVVPPAGAQLSAPTASSRRSTSWSTGLPAVAGLDGVRDAGRTGAVRPHARRRRARRVREGVRLHEVRPDVGSALAGSDGADAHGFDAGACRPARALDLRAVRAVPAARGRLGSHARRARRSRDRAAGRGDARPEVARSSPARC